MAIVHKRSKRKPSGGRYYRLTKKLSDLGSLPTLTKVGETSKKTRREKSGSLKTILLTADKANVYNSKTKKYQSSDILKVIENKANRNYIRRNIITKGAVIETKLGKARVVSRPGQEGTVNAILLE